MTLTEAIAYLFRRLPELRRVRPFILPDAAGLADAAGTVLAALKILDNVTDPK